MRWRYIPFQHYSPYFKTGLNKALMESVREDSDPVVFLSGWSPNAVNLGYSQSFEEEVNQEEFERRDDVVLVRRQGGGGATYLTEDGEITWGLIAPEEKFPEDVNKVYQQVCSSIARGLASIGIDAEHQPVNDIVTDRGKISGATMKREDGVVYIGGTLLYSVDAEEMFSLLTPDEDKLKDKQIKEFRERVTSVEQETDASFEEAIEALKKGLTEIREIYEDDLKPSEVERAEELADKYSSRDWLYR
ncbi:lipoate--protein ligase family protein [Candidatus Nanohaloarchaea archaeon]|nr:lipoate--protein ligase family protein [Candidatus Nanohaloarchaea archaeon]